MTEEIAAPPSGQVEPKKSSRTWIIVLVVVLVLCCLCVVLIAVGWALWTYGDEWFGLSQVPRILAAL